MTEQEIIQAVQEKYSNINFPDPVLEPVHWGKREHSRIPGRKAIVNQKDGNVFNVCTDEYKILRHEVVIHFVEDSLSHFMDGDITCCPRLMQDGAKLVMATKFNGRGHEILKGDNVIPKIEVFNSYDLGWKLNGRWGMWRLRCSNGAGVWERFTSYAKRHLQNLFVEDLRDSIQEGLGLFEEQASMWKEWAETKVDAPTYEKLWVTLPFSKAEKEKIEALPEIGTQLLLPDALYRNDLTLWQLNNVLTQFSTHEIKSEMRRVEIEPQIAKVMEQTFKTLNG
jgi:hypothetical protein